jgi:hypothetical protein
MITLLMLSWKHERNACIVTELYRYTRAPRNLWQIVQKIYVKWPYYVTVWKVSGSIDKKEGRGCHLLLKGQLREIFDPRFFSSSNPPYGPDSRPKVVLHMASYSPRKSIIFEFMRCHWHHGNDFSGFIDTAEMISAVWLTQLKRRWWQSEKFNRDINYRIFPPEFQRCQWHRWNDFRGVIDNAETISAVSLTPLTRFQRCQWHRWN